MAARIGVGAKVAIRIAANNEGHANKLKCHVVAGVWHLIDMAHEIPYLHEDAVDFTPVKFVGGIDPWRHSRCLIERFAYLFKSTRVERMARRLHSYLPSLGAHTTTRIGVGLKPAAGLLI